MFYNREIEPKITDYLDDREATIVLGSRQGVS